MWEKDKHVLGMYRECMQNLMNDLKAGEEVEWEDACSVESAKLQQYTFDMVWLYKQRTSQNANDLQQKAWKPRIPYNQNI